MNALLAAGLAVSLQFSFDPAKPAEVTVEARHAPPRSSLSLQRVAKEGMGPAIFATVESNEDGLVLRPSFPLERGESYVARLRLPDGTVREAKHRVPAAKAAARPQVLRVYPGAKRLPANLLKFYIEFSEPMREGREIFDQIRILDERGRAVHSPWRRQELWSEEARRLSLWIHPGRVKRGVNLRETMGPVLVPGRRYRLVIEGSVRSAAGTPMGRAHVQPFETVAEDHEMPRPEKWSLSSPSAKGRAPLRVMSSEPLDHALLKRCQWIEDADGERVVVSFEGAPDATRWTLTPEKPWRSGRYFLCVDEWLEDLAGNTPARPFERDVSEPERRFELIRVPFVVQPFKASADLQRRRRPAE